MPLRNATTTADYTVADQARMRRATNYFEWQARLAMESMGQRVIEIGCGLGNFTQHLLDRDLVVGIDVVEDCLAELRARYPGRPNLQTLCLDVLDPRFVALKVHRPDTVVCLNVLEHVRDDRLALEHIYDVLEPGGRAVFILPAFESLHGPIDEQLGHFRRYSKRPWAELSQSVGFRVASARYVNSVGCVGWWLNAKVLRRTEQSEGQIALFDAVVVPILSRVERRVEPPFGQSIVTILQKPG